MKAIRGIQMDPVRFLKCYTGVFAGTTVIGLGYKLYKEGYLCALNCYANASLIYFASQGPMLCGFKLKPGQYAYSLIMLGLSFIPNDFLVAKFLSGMPM